MDEVRWAEVEQERRSLADLLDGLTPQQWESGSLCTRWRVRDVAAHVAMTPLPAPTARTLLVELARARGRLWEAGAQVAIEHAARPPAQLVDELRQHAASRRTPWFVVHDNLLLDLLVHGQDIAVPLGIDRPMPGPAAQAGFSRAWSMAWPFHARRRLSGLRLVATDAPVDVGSRAGPRVEGRLADLLLLVTERTEAALARLDGDGVALVRSGGRGRGHAGTARGARS